MNFMDTAFKIQRHALNVSNFEGNHTAHSIKEKVHYLLEFSLSKHIPHYSLPIYFATDNGHNIKQAITSNKEWKHISYCSAPALQLCITDAKRNVPDVENLFARARHIVGHFKHSSIRRKKREMSKFDKIYLKSHWCK